MRIFVLEELRERLCMHALLLNEPLYREQRLKYQAEMFFMLKNSMRGLAFQMIEEKTLVLRLIVDRLEYQVSKVLEL